MSDYERGQNNPHQERPSDELTYGEAIEAIARRVSFGTEEEQRAVLAAIAKEHAESSPAETEGDDDEEGDEASGGSSSTTPPVKAAKATRGRPPR